MFKITFFIITLTVSISTAQEQYTLIQKSFSNLAYSYKVRYNPDISQEILKSRDSYPKDHPLYTDEFGSDDIVIIKTKLIKGDSTWYYVLFTEGPSADPSFYFINAENPDQYFGSLAGEELVLPGNNFAYTEGRADNDFTKRMKFKITKSGFEEVFQPFYYVGLQSYTLVPITLYKEKNEKEPIATLPANYAVEVILTDDITHYLIKTPFGLLGWVTIPSSQYKSKVIEGIYFQGD